MQRSQENLFFRNDTIFGVCEAIGTDLGFNPNWLRLAFAAPIYWNPGLVVGIYLALGLVVLASRYAFPDKIADIGQPATAPQLVAERPAQDVEQERELEAA